MKISKKLKQQIDLAVYNEVFGYLCELDRLERNGLISTEAWRLTHKPACGLTDKIADEVIHKIEMY